MPRKAGSKAKPALQFDPPVKKHKMSIEISAKAAELVRNYPDFIKKTQEATPTVDEVIEKCILKVLGGDAAYKEYRGNSVNSGAASGNK